jgi:hypothetical protein
MQALTRTRNTDLPSFLLPSVMPTPPDFSKPSYACDRGRPAEVVKLAEAGDAAALRGYGIRVFYTGAQAIDTGIGRSSRLRRSGPPARRPNRRSNQPRRVAPRGPGRRRLRPPFAPRRKSPSRPLPASRPGTMRLSRTRTTAFLRHPPASPADLAGISKTLAFADRCDRPGSAMA